MRRTRRRSIALIAGLIASTLTNTPAAAQPSLLRLKGKVGAAFEITLKRGSTVELSKAEFTASRNVLAGVLLAESRSEVSPDGLQYDAVAFRVRGLKPVIQLGADDHTSLDNTRYVFILLGGPGAVITATIPLSQPASAPIHLRATLARVSLESVERHSRPGDVVSAMRDLGHDAGRQVSAVGVVRQEAALAVGATGVHTAFIPTSRTSCPGGLAPVDNVGSADSFYSFAYSSLAKGHTEEDYRRACLQANGTREADNLEVFLRVSHY